eukprot:2070713-Amphidinium_carterae.1
MDAPLGNVTDANGNVTDANGNETGAPLGNVTDANGNETDASGASQIQSCFLQLPLLAGPSCLAELCSCEYWVDTGRFPFHA